ncbi:hypothetical protein VOLCADRAFT_78675 [Volvox carteri f. nagariensis]|uniref:Ubiquitin carboxyl-terminal hydrolase n=1 Tax=Volvox carteri f. nagariensis TaxID=3068 RepID=D8THD1_VOLCA|nr:uncharacterized protein VOLCADRAFT_78675 [Volvox carteri f. nagariensis]EFJ53050.1 hypothetical protein VOLCADRAFT_78675 [Volvox carteri f. nagariensis]|eukprot:XP_002946055.1 hypothetical protein VOLCADRAFT_78675 [Volvox carteri f. nagariensis]
MTQTVGKRPAEDMTQVKLNVKWGKETYNDVEVDVSQPPLVFKSQLFALTGVPPDRQKVMIKGALLKDDEWGKSAPKEGMTIMLMGSAEAVPVEAPKNIPKFVEDLPEAEQEHLETKRFGAGLHNLGNTCYMNSTLQCMFAVQPLREALYKKASGAGGDPTGRLVTAIAELFKDLESGGAPFPPYAFLVALRAKFPQFAQQTQGVFAQQDAEECWTNVMYAMREKVKDEDGNPVVDKLFGMRTRLRLKSDESAEEFTEDGMTYTLKVNIEEKTAHVSEGVALGLKEERERSSVAMGRTVVFRGGTSLTALPPFLTLQMMRFFFRRDNGQKAKILKKIPFSLEFDAFEFCSDELKKELEAPRVAYKEAQDREIEAKKLAKKGPGPSAVATASAASGTLTAANAVADVDMKEAAVASTSAPTTSSSTKLSMTGKYELVGVVTHKGRTADSGHYVAWVKQSSDGTWVCFDDDKITVRTEEEVLQLSGGGDWHMAYLLLYRAIMVDMSGAVPAAVSEAAQPAAAMETEGGSSA